MGGFQCEYGASELVSHIPEIHPDSGCPGIEGVDVDDPEFHILETPSEGILV